MPYFGKARRPSVIVSVSGFTSHERSATDDRWPLYQRVAQSLSELDTGTVNILPQTLSPFPWYFGGQTFSNILVDPEDIVIYCTKFEQKVYPYI
jgi:N-acetylneuraminate synthase